MDGQGDKKLNILIIKVSNKKESKKTRRKEMKCFNFFFWFVRGEIISMSHLGWKKLIVQKKILRKYFLFVFLIIITWSHVVWDTQDMEGKTRMRAEVALLLE